MSEKKEKQKKEKVLSPKKQAALERREQRRAEDERRRAAMPKLKKQPLWVTMITVAVALALAVAIYFAVVEIKASLNEYVYDTPEEAAAAYFDALENRDYEKELSCYPPEVKNYFLENAGGEEAYAQNFEAICDQYEGMSVTVGTASPADGTSLENLEIFKDRVGATFKPEEVVHVSFTYTSTQSSAPSSSDASSEIDDSGYYVTCVRLGERWYVFLD